MRVAIDARYVHTSTDEVRPAGGIGRYTLELVRHLPRLDPSLELVLVVPATNGRPVADVEMRPRVREVRWSAPPHSLRTLFSLARRIELGGIDIFHSPFNVLPRALPCPAITTVHDLMWLDAPELAAAFWPKRLVTGTYYRYGIAHALARSAHVLTVSKATQQAILRRRAELADRLTVAYNGVGSEFAPMPEADAVASSSATMPAGARFVLCVGQGSPYKNHARAVEAFLLAYADRPDVRLVLLRRFSRWDRAMKRLLGRAEVRERLLVLPQVGQRELHRLYCRAEALLFPSITEGFGLPIIEAMACGTPVVTADRGAMREIAGDAALLVDPCSTTSIAEALRRLDRDRALRAELIARGRLRAGRFRWEDTARTTLAVYRRVAAETAVGKRC